MYARLGNIATLFKMQKHSGNGVPIGRLTNLETIETFVVVFSLGGSGLPSGRRSWEELLQRRGDLEPREGLHHIDSKGDNYACCGKQKTPERKA